MAARVSNRFFATNVKDGKSVSAIMRSNMTLSQVVIEGGACAPSWDIDTQGIAKIPHIWVWTRLAGNTTNDITDVKWLWNGSEITFDANGASQTPFVVTEGSTTQPLFHLGISGDTNYPCETEGETNPKLPMPTLYIVNDIGKHSQATDNNTLSMTGKFVVTGSTIDFTVNTSIRIQESSASGYLGTLTGDPRITDENPVTVLTARLYQGANNVQNFYTKWYINEALAWQQGTTNGYVNSPGASATGWKINKASVNDNAVVRVDFYTPTQTQLLATAMMSVDDETDVMELQVTSEVFTGGVSGGSGQGDVMLRSGQEVQWTFWMGHRTNPTEVYAGYDHFFVKLTDNKGNEITPANIENGASGIDTRYGTLKAYIEASGGTALSGDAMFKDVTLANDLSTANGDVVNGSGGRLKLTFSQIETWGDGIGGIILAV